MLSDFKLVRVYDDTLASADNEFSRIAAGNYGMFMIYGITGTWLWYNSNTIPLTARARIMATDRKGNFLWRQNLAEGLTQGDILPLDDGGCLVAATINADVNPSLTYNCIYIYRFDKDGNKISSDSISVVPHVGTNPYSVNNSHFLKTTSGRIIIYGNAYCDLGNSSYSKGFIIDYSLGGGVQSFKTIYFPAPGTRHYIVLTGGMETPDGFLFSGEISDSLQQPLLVKTNSSGDMLWHKRFGLFGNYDFWNINMISAPGGNFRFCTNNNLWSSPLKATMNVYEVNANGDSVGFARYDELEANLAYTLLATDDGGFFTLVNKTPYYINPFFDAIFEQTNTRKVFFNAEMKKMTDGAVQAMTTDFFTSACKTPEGRIACFGFFKPVGKSYYRPELIFLN